MLLGFNAAIIALLACALLCVLSGAGLVLDSIFQWRSCFKEVFEYNPRSLNGQGSSDAGRTRTRCAAGVGTLPPLATPLRAVPGWHPEVASVLLHLSARRDESSNGNTWGVHISHVQPAGMSCKRLPRLV